MKLKAFTLVEVLITASILGIILILAVPKVMNNIADKNNVLALQKVYSAVSDNVKLVLQDEQTKDLNKTYLFKGAGETVTSSAGDFLKKYFSINADCGTKKVPCLANSYKTLNKSSNLELPDDGNLYCVLLSSQASVCIVPPQTSSNGVVFVDVNGSDSPNVAGKDLFSFYIYEDGFVGDRENNANLCSSSKTAEGCLNKLINSDWVINY